MTPEAVTDLGTLHAYISRDAPRTADRWAQGLRRHVRSLGTFPERYEVVPEFADLPDNYRQFLYGNYRVIYRVEQKRVLVVRIVHGARILRPPMLPDV
jgi:toxin ParE1/3/4